MDRSQAHQAMRDEGKENKVSLQKQKRKIRGGALVRRGSQRGRSGCIGKILQKMRIRIIW
jgi:hypothetical protein